VAAGVLGSPLACWVTVTVADGAAAGVLPPQAQVASPVAARIAIRYAFIAG
jgi:hypothetical protein